MKKSKEFLEDLKQSLGSFQLEIVLPQEERNKLEALKDDDRDVTGVSSITLDKMLQAFVAALETSNNLVDDTSTAMDHILENVALAYRDDVAERIRTGRKDLPLRPLSRQYVKQKGNARIGYLKGSLQRAIASAKVRIKHKGANTR